jgi:hypothetical protein
LAGAFFAVEAGAVLAAGAGAVLPPAALSQLLIVIGEILNLAEAWLTPPRPFVALVAKTKLTTSSFCASV